MKFSVTGDQWLGPSISRVMCRVKHHNRTNGAGFPIFGQPLLWNPAVLFRRVRLICGGHIAEDIDGFNRLRLMLTELFPEDDQHGIACEGFRKFDYVC